MRRFAAALLLALFCTAAPITAAPYDEMDYGPFLSHTFQLPNGNTTLRGIAVAFDAPIPGEVAPPLPPPVKGKPQVKTDPAKCGVLFDTELLRYSGWWNGGFITWTGVVFNGNHGANPGPAGKLIAATNMTAGVGPSFDKFVDPRGYPHGLPMCTRDWPVTRAFTAAGTTESSSPTPSAIPPWALDMPSVEFLCTRSNRLFSTLNLSPSKVARQMVIADLPNGNGMSNVPSMLVLQNAQDAVVADVSGGPKGTEFDHEFGTRMVLKIPASAESAQIRVGKYP